MHLPHLFSPLQVGPYRLQHRIVMAPLTRMRADRSSFVPRALNAEYYGQRATPGGLLIAEATPVMVQGRGNPGVPGIYSDAQVAGWRGVVDAVHDKDGLISGMSAASRIPRFSPAGSRRSRRPPCRSRAKA
jgi:N-ethylmaleimide reductase